MTNTDSENNLIKKILNSSKIIAMIGVSSSDKNVDSKNIKRRPSIIVMKYLQEFGYKVIPVNPSAEGKKINNETFVGKIEDIKTPVDIVNVFRPSKEAAQIAKQTVKLGAKTLWLQYGIQSEEAKKIVTSKNISYIGNRCIKQEYQKLFMKMSPVFPALKAD